MITPPGRTGLVFVTDANGNVVQDITVDRVKPIIPGQGFSDKEATDARGTGSHQAALAMTLIDVQ